jgi:hypothetical protein
MKKKLKQQWVAALRSGKYRQAKEYLHVPTFGYCCLGVLCDIVDDTKWVDWNNTRYNFGDRSKCTYPTLDWLDRIGLLDNDAEHLTILNDIRNKTFSEIADWIETNIKETNDDYDRS